MRRSTRIMAGLVTGLLGLSAVAACGGDDSGSGAGASLSVGWMSPPDTLNPATTGARAVGPLVAAMFETLVYLTPDLKPTPGLATSWKVSADSKTYTFQLRDGVKFHDGTEFDAQAVVDNIDYITAKETKSTIAIGLLGPCTDAEAAGKLQIVLTCKEPYAPLLKQLGEPYLGIQSPKAIKQYGSDLGQHPVGTGPFKFVSYTPNQALVLKRNEQYDWAPKAAGTQGPAKLANLKFQFIPNNQSRVGALQSNQVQVISSTPGVFYKRFRGEYGLLPNPISGMGVFSPVNASKWPTSDKSVRRAIFYALNRKDLIDAASNGVLPESKLPLSKGMLGYDEKLEDMYEFSPEKAEQELEKGGWEKRGDGWYKDGRKLALKITAISTSSTYPAAAKAMAGNLEAIGMKATVEEMGSAAWVDNNVKGGMNLTPLTYVAVDPDALSFWTFPDSFYNWSHYKNPDLVDLLKKGRQETDEGKRAEIYAKAQQMILEEAVLYPIFENQDLLAASKKVRGIAYTGGGFESFYGVTISE